MFETILKYAVVGGFAIASAIVLFRIILRDWTKSEAELKREALHICRSAAMVLLESWISSDPDRKVVIETEGTGFRLTLNDSGRHIAVESPDHTFDLTEIVLMAINQWNETEKG